MMMLLWSLPFMPTVAAAAAVAVITGAIRATSNLRELAFAQL